MSSWLGQWTKIGCTERVCWAVSWCRIWAVFNENIRCNISKFSKILRKWWWCGSATFQKWKQAKLVFSRLRIGSVVSVVFYISVEVLLQFLFILDAVWCRLFEIVKVNGVCMSGLGVLSQFSRLVQILSLIFWKKEYMFPLEESDAISGSKVFFSIQLVQTV